jgi:3-hydroxybutyryl-CoA dehydrogenase
MDLVGVDTGFEVSKSFFEQSFGEPRWRPSPIAARYVAAGLHGRKSGRGYYDYGGGEGSAGTGGSAAGRNRYRVEDPAALDTGPPGHGEGVLVIAGEGVLADELRGAAVQAGFEVRSPHAPTGGVLPALIVDCDCEQPSRADGQSSTSATPDRRGAVQPQGGARLLLCAGGSLGALDPGGSAVGFHVLPPLEGAELVELTRGDSSSPVAAARAERLFEALGKHVVWVGDAPAFALGEGVGEAHDIDTGMVLGLSHPRGPLQWADEIGLDHVLAVLGALWEEYREERYRPAPELRRLAHAGRLGRAAGAGFFDYAAPS